MTWRSPSQLLWTQFISFLSAVHKDATHLLSNGTNNELNCKFFVETGYATQTVCSVSFKEVLMVLFFRFPSRTTEVMELFCPFFTKEDNLSYKVYLSHLMTPTVVTKVHYLKSTSIFFLNIMFILKKTTVSVFM